MEAKKRGKRFRNQEGKYKIKQGMNVKMAGSLRECLC